MKEAIVYTDGSVKEYNGYYYLGYAYFENKKNNRSDFIRIPTNEISYQDAIIKSEMLALKLALDNGYSNVITDNVSVHTYATINLPEINVTFKCRKGNKAHKLAKTYIKTIGI